MVNFQIYLRFVKFCKIRIKFKGPPGVGFRRRHALCVSVKNDLVAMRNKSGELWRVNNLVQFYYAKF